MQKMVKAHIPLVDSEWKLANMTEMRYRIVSTFDSKKNKIIVVILANILTLWGRVNCFEKETNVVLANI